VNDPKNPKNLPPDDFSKTTPYIRLPKEESSSSSSGGAAKDDYTSDWEKTNFNFIPPPQQSSSSPRPATPEDDWGKTAVNINIPRNNSGGGGNQQDDFGRTFMPGQTSYPQQPQQPSSGWDMTQANINLGGGGSGGQEDFGGSPRQSDFGATTPYIQLPEAERARYQNVNQPTATATAPTAPAVTSPQTGEKSAAKKSGTPAWVWFGGVAALFFLLAAVIVGAYFIFSKRYGYDVLVKGAQPQSEVFVDGTRWGYTSGTGDILVSGLTAGAHKIEIRHPNFTYEVEQITGEDGGKTVEVIAKSRPKQQQVEPPKDECANIRKGDFAKAEKCANDALDKLGDNFTVDELLRAMNLYIINFASGKYDIPPNNLKFLEKSAGYMKKLPPNVVIEVGGHTDNVGNDANNLKLSENRANSVKNALINFGVRADILQMKGYGESKPKSSNDTEDGKFQNRRIEYIALSK
jgi:outer membrane protein OmpA-like peptidoglycan-associated protein